MIGNLRILLNSYKYATLGWIWGSVVFGIDYGFIIALVGMLVDLVFIAQQHLQQDTTTSKTVPITNEQREKDRATFLFSSWMMLSIFFSLFYTLVICLGTGPNSHGGPINYWINFTKPFVSSFSDCLPAIKNYTSDLLEINQEWRIPRATHLVVMNWIFNSIFFTILLPTFRLIPGQGFTIFNNAVIADQQHTYYISWIKQYFIRIGAIMLSMLILYLCLEVGMEGMGIGNDKFGRRVESVMWIFYLMGFLSLYGLLGSIITIFSIHYYSHIKPLFNKIK